MYLIFPLLYYIFLRGSNFSDGFNGYIFMMNINIISIFLADPTFFQLINLNMYDKLMPYIKYYDSSHIFSNRIFNILYFFLMNITTFIFITLITFVFCILDTNNLKIFPTMILVILFQNIYNIFVASSLYYVFESIQINILYNLLNIIIQISSVGLYGANNSGLKHISISYYLMNYLSIKAQEIYNYPVLYGDKYVYTLYGYSSNITYYLLLYALSFFIFPILLYLIKKNNKIFFS